MLADLLFVLAEPRGHETMRHDTGLRSAKQRGLERQGAYGITWSMHYELPYLDRFCVIQLECHVDFIHSLLRLGCLLVYCRFGWQAVWNGTDSSLYAMVQAV